MRAALLGLLLVMPLAACSLNPKEAPANQRAQHDAADAATCTGFGFKKDTPEFANCLMTLDEQHKGYGAASHPVPSIPHPAQDTPKYEDDHSADHWA